MVYSKSKLEIVILLINTETPNVECTKKLFD